MLSALYASLFYAATAVLVAGVAWRILQYARAPAPLRIPTTPAPMTRAGAASRVAREVLFFESLFRSNKWIW
ncbi:MAG: nitrate reductase, partial [Burkholderiales bacterium]